VAVSSAFCCAHLPHASVLAEAGPRAQAGFAPRYVEGAAASREDVADDPRSFGGGVAGWRLGLLCGDDEAVWRGAVAGGGVVALDVCNDHEAGYEGGG